MGSECIHNPRLECWWYVPSSLSSYPSKLSWFYKEVGQSGSSRCHFSSLMKRFLGYLPLPLSLRMTIGSVVLKYSISIGSISSNFYMFDIWIHPRQDWWFLSMSGGERVRRCVFLKYLWVIAVDDSLKYSHVSISTEFMWCGVNLRVPLCLVQFILALPYNFLSFRFGTLSFWWKTGCGAYGGYPMPYYQNGCYGHHRIELGDLGDRSNTWR